MSKSILFFILIFLAINLSAQKISNSNTVQIKKSKVDYNAFENLVIEVKQHREKRLVSLSEFVKMSSKPDCIILDTRSKHMYDRKHVKGAIHLNFSDFTKENLLSLLPNLDTKILIYCNNNIEDDTINFATKAVIPKLISKDIKVITLALNIPTYINLYGYGYRNIYELSELISVQNNKITFEGTEVNK